MKSMPLVIASTANERYAIGLGVMMCSAVTCSAGRAVRFHVIDDGILAETRLLLVDRVHKVAAEQGIQVELNFIDFAKITLPPLAPLHGSLAAYGRIFLPYLLNEESVIHVDADIICNREFPDPGDVGARFSGALLAACPIPGKPLESDCPWLDEVGGDESGNAYFNTGYLWMNLACLREFGLQEKFRALADRGKSMRFADQTALNFLCRGRIGTLPSEFNHLWNKSSGLTPDARVNVHFVGSIKPWDAKLSGETVLEISLFNAAAAHFGFPCGDMPERTMRKLMNWHNFGNLMKVVYYRLTFSKRLRKARAHFKRSRLMGAYIRAYGSGLRKTVSLPHG